MTISPQLTKLLAALPESQQLNFFAFWEAIYQARYTGDVRVHCLGGLPKQIGLGNPVLLSICEGEPPAAAALDNAQPGSVSSRT